MPSGIKGGRMEEALEGMSLHSFRRPINFANGFRRDQLWAVTVVKMYVKSLKTGEIPNYPREPTKIGWKF